MQANPADRNGLSTPPKAASVNKIWYGLIPLGLAGAAAGYFYLSSPETTERVFVPVPQEVVTPVITTPPEAPVQAVIETPPESGGQPATETTTQITQAPPAPKQTPQPKPATRSLPSLDDSDPLALDELTRLSLVSQLKQLIEPQEIIRNFVTFVDNLSRGQLETTYSPVKRPDSRFMVIERDDRIYLDPRSYQRYDLYVDIINAIDIDRAIASYRLLKPLLQQAYAELGFPDEDFSLILQEAIQGLLDAPIIEEEIELVAPSAMYQFADSGLQALPPAQKLMIRLGSANNLKLRPKLQQLQTALFADGE